MFGLAGFMLSPKMEKAQQERQERELQERLARAEPWTAKTAFRRALTLKAETWPTWSLFDVKPTKHNNVNREPTPEGKFALSPGGRFMFCMKTLPKTERITLLQGSRRGNVMFDGPVDIPSLYERTGDGTMWREHPWMSLTPMEVMTQRPGTRLAHGHVVIAGLGLGWGLVEAFKKRTVTKVTLVERSQELVDWVMPVLAPMLRGFAKDFDTIVGDARDVLWDFKADVALVDIFTDYGSNEFTVRNPDGSNRFGGVRPKNIETVWCWGSAPVADEGRRWY